MPEIVRIRVEVDQRSNAAITQIVGLKKTIDEINATHINVQVDNANQLEQITRKMTAYNNSVARRIQAELQLATAIENRKGEESKAQAAAERRKAAEERTTTYACITFISQFLQSNSSRNLLPSLEHK